MTLQLLSGQCVLQIHSVNPTPFIESHRFTVSFSKCPSL